MRISRRNDALSSDPRSVRSGTAPSGRRAGPARRHGALRAVVTTTLAATMLSATLLVAGLGGGASAAATAEGTWSTTANLPTARSQAMAEVLGGGDVLVAGGFTKPGGSPTADCELYDPAKGSWSSTGALPLPLADAATALLPGGDVLLVGGETSVSGALVPTGDAEIYDPGAGRWSAVAPLPGGLAVRGAAAVTLKDGDVLVAGGMAGTGSSEHTTSAAEVYDPGTNRWTATTGGLSLGVSDASAVLLGSGKVLVAGGIAQSGGGSPSVTRVAEVYDPGSGSFSDVSTMPTGVAYATSTLLPSGEVLLAGGEESASGTPSASTQLFDPSNAAWTAGGSLPVASFGATATLLETGEVLYAGGFSSSGDVTSTSALYDPATKAWTRTGSLVLGRAFAVAEAIGGGKVLVAGGEQSASADTDDAEIYLDGTAPAITSPSSLDVHPGVAVDFTVTTTGTPTPSILASGQLPGGLSFRANSDGTATISGTPSSGSTGTYTLDLTASNGVSPNATQTLTISVTPQDSAPAITSPSSLDAHPGVAVDFTVTTTGTPTPSILASGQLPGGLSFRANSDGTATISGTPSSGSTGTYTLDLTASNGVSPNATQTLTISVTSLQVAPSFTSPATLQLATGAYRSFTVTTTGNPTPSITASGRLPAGVGFSAKPGGTATISGTPSLQSAGTYDFYLTASNGVGVPAHQTLLITVVQAVPVSFSSSDSFTMHPGTYSSFTVRTNGSPTPRVVESGSLPPGVSFSSGLDGTATISGDPSPAGLGDYTLHLTASNSLGSTAYQTFSLHVTEHSAPAITSAPRAVVRAGTYVQIIVRASGNPAPRLEMSGHLPDGLRFLDNGNGSAYIRGTIAPQASGSYAIGLSASNGVGATARQTLEIVVVPGPRIVFENGSSLEIATRAYGKLEIVARGEGSPAPTLSMTGRLPLGVRFVQKGGGRAYLVGRPWESAAGSYVVRITASNGVAPKAVQVVRIVVTRLVPPRLEGGRVLVVHARDWGKLRIVALGSPVPQLLLSGRLPAGLRFIATPGHAVAFIAGRPFASSTGAYELVLEARNGVGQPARETIRIVVLQAVGR